MELYTDDLLLKTVTNEDIEEVARMWKFEKGSISLDEALEAVEYMQNNHRQNCPGYIRHLCFAVFEKDKRSIIGWCGLDGQCTPGETVIFYMIDKDYRRKGYATQCACKLLEHAFETVGLQSVHGGCYKDNIASYKVMEKAGMIQNAFEENGDPLFTIDRNGYYALK
jgi:RimJ/RimL family protein N-acetyltransferase